MSIDSNRFVLLKSEVAREVPFEDDGGFVPPPPEFCPLMSTLEWSALNAPNADDTPNGDRDFTVTNTSADDEASYLIFSREFYNAGDDYPVSEFEIKDGNAAVEYIILLGVGSLFNFGMSIVFTSPTEVDVNVAPSGDPLVTGLTVSAPYVFGVVVRAEDSEIDFYGTDGSIFATLSDAQVAEILRLNTVRYGWGMNVPQGIGNFGRIGWNNGQESFVHSYPEKALEFCRFAEQIACPQFFSSDSDNVTVTNDGKDLTITKDGSDFNILTNTGYAVLDNTLQTWGKQLYELYIASKDNSEFFGTGLRHGFAAGFIFTGTQITMDAEGDTLYMWAQRQFTSDAFTKKTALFNVGSGEVAEEGYRVGCYLEGNGFSEFDDPDTPTVRHYYQFEGEDPVWFDPIKIMPSAFSGNPTYFTNNLIFASDNEETPIGDAVTIRAAFQDGEYEVTQIPNGVVDALGGAITGTVPETTIRQAQFESRTEDSAPAALKGVVSNGNRRLTLDNNTGLGQSCTTHTRTLWNQQQLQFTALGIELVQVTANQTIDFGGEPLNVAGGNFFMQFSPGNGLRFNDGSFNVIDGAYTPQAGDRWLMLWVSDNSTAGAFFPILNRGGVFSSIVNGDIAIDTSGWNGVSMMPRMTVSVPNGEEIIIDHIFKAADFTAAEIALFQSIISSAPPPVDEYPLVDLEGVEL